MKDRRLLIIFAIVLVDLTSFSLVIPLLPYYAERFGAPVSVTGLIYAAYPLAQLLGAALLGRLSDMYGRKPILLVSIAGTVGALLLLGFANALWMVFASRVLDGLTGGNISVAQAYMADVTSEADRGKAFGLVGAAFGLGFILGPLTGGLLSRVGDSLPPFVAAAMATMNFLLVLFVLRESLTPERRALVASEPGHGFNLRELSGALRLPRVGPLLWIRIFTSLAFAMFETGFAIWAAKVLHLAAWGNGLVLSYVGVLSVAIQLGLIGRLTARFTDAHLIVGGSSLAAVALAAWGFTPSVWVLIAIMPFLSLGLAVTNTILGSALTKAVYPDEVGGVVGLSTSLQSMTRIPAPIIAGILLERATAWSPGVLAGVLTAAIVPYAFSRLIAKPAPPLPPRPVIEPAAIEA